jgi:adenine-specific DNA-methyltransferase
LAPYVGKAGKLRLNQLRVEALDQAEEYLLFAATTDEGDVLDPDIARRLFSLSALSQRPLAEGVDDARLQEILAQQQAHVQGDIARRNMAFLEAESAKLDGWADDMKASLERDIKELDRQIKEARRAANLAATLEEKLAGQKQVKALEVQRNSKRRALFDAQDEIDRRREKLIEDVEAKLQQAVQVEPLLSIRWELR